MVPSAPIKCLTHKTEFFTIKDALRHIWKLHNMRMLVSHATKVWCCGKSIGYYGTPDYDDEEMFKHLWAEHHPVFYTFSVDLDYLRELKLIGPEDEM
ncbi:hypothetical protein N7466_004616 [Penicillium verhagenii]|uniref:uncharacterized protein n=1 Tax=Penicillium verhagenii TaxID=1562060 RepID=UPI0025458655|nr:uncharacterized protein N7466_004616 [Penicillium verhagenii]KAJ5935069.1 hypothetical protein N7466_004616 [Penicillium verhagenii]